MKSKKNCFADNNYLNVTNREKGRKENKLYSINTSLLLVIKFVKIVIQSVETKKTMKFCIFFFIFFNCKRKLLHNMLQVERNLKW